MTKIISEYLDTKDGRVFLLRDDVNFTVPQIPGAKVMAVSSDEIQQFAAKEKESYV